MYRGDSRRYFSLDLSGMGPPKILTFLALKTKNQALFSIKFDQKRLKHLKHLCVNAFIFNQQALPNLS